MPARPDEIAPSTAWLDAMREATDGAPAPVPEPAVRWHTLETECGQLTWQLVSAQDSLPGRRLLILEVDAAQAERVLEAISGLADGGVRERRR